MSSSAFAVAVLVVTAAVAGRSSDPLPPSPLEVRLAAPAHAATDGAVRVDFTLTNHGEAAVWVLTWRTPLEGILGDIFTVRHGGRPVAYRGPMVKRGDPERDDYLRVPAGGSVTASVDLAAAYDLTAAGSYAIAFEGGLLDVASDSHELPRPRDGWRPVAAPSNTVTVRVTGE